MKEAKKMNLFEPGDGTQENVIVGEAVEVDQIYSQDDNMRDSTTNSEPKFLIEKEGSFRERYLTALTALRGGKCETLWGSVKDAYLFESEEGNLALELVNNSESFTSELKEVDEDLLKLKFFLENRKAIEERSIEIYNASGLAEAPSGSNNFNENVGEIVVVFNDPHIIHWSAGGFGQSRELMELMVEAELSEKITVDQFIAVDKGGYLAGLLEDSYRLDVGYYKTKVSTNDLHLLNWGYKYY